MLSSMAPNALSHGDSAPDDGAEDCITRVRRFWWVELGSLPRCRPTRRRDFPDPLFHDDSDGFVSWVDILLDVISGVESVLQEGCPRTTTGVSQHWFSVHFRLLFFNTIALPRINIGADVWGVHQHTTDPFMTVEQLPVLSVHEVLPGGQEFRHKPFKISPIIYHNGFHPPMFRV